MVEQFSKALYDGSPLAFGLAFASGVLASLTPCVYPVIPITVSFFSGRAKSHVHAIWLSINYVLGMALVYAALGVFAALTGKVFGKITMNAPVFFVVGSIILLFGLMELEWIKIKIPSFNIAQRSSPNSAILMGMTSGFIVAPCTVPILGVILTYIASKQDFVMGASLMFVFALGLGLLFMFLGIFTSFVTRIPKSGRWMLWIEKGAGVLFVFLGCYFIYRGFELL